MMLFEFNINNINIGNDINNFIIALKNIGIYLEKSELTINDFYFGEYGDYLINLVPFSPFAYMQLYLREFVKEDYIYITGDVEDYIKSNIDAIKDKFKEWVGKLLGLGLTMGLLSPYPLHYFVIRESPENTLLQRVRVDPCGAIHAIFISDSPSPLSHLIIRLLNEPVVPFIGGEDLKDFIMSFRGGRYKNSNDLINDLAAGAVLVRRAMWP